MYNISDKYRKQIICKNMKKHNCDKIGNKYDFSWKLETKQIVNNIYEKIYFWDPWIKKRIKDTSFEEKEKKLHSSTKKI